MACNPDDIRWLMEWFVICLVVLAFWVAAAYRWATEPRKEAANHGD